MISQIPGVHLYTQYPAWADDKWHYRGAVFDSFAPSIEPLGRREPGCGRLLSRSAHSKTSGSSGFFDVCWRSCLRDADVLWQTGDTDVSGLGIVGHHAIPERELTRGDPEADVLVAHAGVGTALAAFEVGKCPVLVPRRVAHGEHVDDHQTQIAAELSNRGLAVSVEADELTLDHLFAAAAKQVLTLPDGSAVHDARHAAFPVVESHRCTRCHALICAGFVDSPLTQS